MSSQRPDDSAEPTLAEGVTLTHRSEFSEVEDQRLFELVRSRMFADGSGLQVGRYRLIRRLGAGAMGEVQLALDEALDRPVALKFVHAHLGGPHWAERLRVEARALARLEHQNVVGVYDVVEHDGRVLLAMEYFDGGSLREWIQREAPSWAQILAAYLEAGRGLAAAHGAGVVHRDFKPDNALRRSDGRIAVADFGLAAVERRSEASIAGAPIIDMPAELSRADEVKGTPAYMPPEQFVGHSDARSDQFALCVSLYEGLWGRRPFPKRSVADVLAGEVDWTPAPPPSKSPVPGWLWPILRRGLAADPDRRFADLDELLAAVEGHLQARRRRKLWLGSGLAALAVGLLSGATVWWAAREAASEPVDACAALERELDGTWDPARRERLAASFDRVDAPSWLSESAAPVLAELDQWRERWLGSRVELCDARAGGDPVVLDRLGACLERHRRATAATVDRLLAGDADTLREAPLAVSSLPDPRSCEREARQGGPPEPPPRIAAEVDGIRAELAEIEAALMTGELDAALAKADALALAAAELDYAPIEAEVAVARGRALLAGKSEDGFAVLERAVDLAEAARHDRVVAEGWRLMAMVAATEQPDLERGRRWLRRADASGKRLGLDALDEARLAYVSGSLALLAGELDVAVEQLASAQAVFEDQGDLLYAGHAASALGKALLARGEQDRAVEQFERSLAQAELVYGPHHPEVALAAYNLAQVLLEAGRSEQGRALLERAAAGWAAGSTQTVDAARVQFVLAQLDLDAGQFERAREHALAAAVGFEQTLPASDIAHAEAAILLGTAHYFAGEAEPAVAAYRRGIAGVTADYGANDPYVAGYRVALGWALLGAGALDDARFEFDAGLTILEARLGRGEHSVDAQLGLLAVELASGAPDRAAERLAEIAAPPTDELNLSVHELFRGLVRLRLSPGDPEGSAALGRARTLAERVAGGEATLALMLDGVNASAQERRLAGH